MAESFSWLHLTDFHYGLNGQECLWPNLRGPFLESLEDLRASCGPWNAVLFTGDFTQQGKAEEFAGMQSDVLDPLWEVLAKLDSENAKLLAVPGNHDLSRPSSEDDDPAADRLVELGGFEKIEARFWAQPSGSYRNVIQKAFKNYEAWWSSTHHRPREINKGELPGDFSTTVACGTRRIGVVGLNTTFLQLTGENYKERLVWDVRQLHSVCPGGFDRWDESHDVSLILTHQGPDWLTPTARQHGATEITPPGRFAAHLFGHQHELNVQSIRRSGSQHPVLLCQGNSVFGMEKSDDQLGSQRSHGYSAGRIEFDGNQMTLRLWPRIANRGAGRWRFVPDYNMELLQDGGTTPEDVPRRRLSRTKAPVGQQSTQGRPAVVKAKTAATRIRISQRPRIRLGEQTTISRKDIYELMLWLTSEELEQLIRVELDRNAQNVTARNASQAQTAISLIEHFDVSYRGLDQLLVAIAAVAPEPVDQSPLGHLVEFSIEDEASPRRFPATAIPVSGLDALKTFLISNLSTFEMHRMVKKHAFFESFAEKINWTGALSRVVDDFIDAVAKEGKITDELFAILAQQRADQFSEIESIRSECGV